MTPVIIVVILAIVTLGGMWLRRRYRKIERQQLVASIAVIVSRAEHDGAQQSTILAVLRQPDTRWDFRYVPVLVVGTANAHIGVWAEVCVVIKGPGSADLGPAL